MTSARDPDPMPRWKAITYAIVLPMVFVALVFVPAGRLDWLAGWAFVAVMLVGLSLSMLVLARVNPVIFRARSRFQPGTKEWDKVLLAIMLPAMVAEIPLSALDAGRMGWSAMPAWLMVVGFLLLPAQIALTVWAQAVNPFFEPGVRIQSERLQRPVTSGPYAYIRHPGYVGAILMFAGQPLALGSWWGLVPAALASAVLILRTHWEDRLLRAELPGYADYAGRTRYRLVPGVW